MPLPPTLIAPVAGEVITTTAWGVPVTTAVNGLKTGNELVGCILYQEAGNQQFSNNFDVVQMWPAEKVYDSDGFMDDAGDRFVIPVGLNGIYRVEWSLLFGGAQVRAIRAAVLRNQTVLQQVNCQCPYGAVATASASSIWRLADGHTLQWKASQNGTAAETMTVKMISLIRIGNYTPTRLGIEFPPPPGVNPDDEVPLQGNPEIVPS